MTGLSQTDSMRSAAADSMVLAVRDSVAANSTQSHKDVRLFTAENFAHSAYIFDYDSLSLRYSLDSTAVKAYRMDLPTAVGGNKNGFQGDVIPRMLKHQDSIFLALLLCFFLISKIIQRGYRFFSEGLRVLFTFREKRDEFNEITVKEFWGNLFLILLPAFLMALMGYQYLQSGDDTLRPVSHMWLTIGGFALVVAVFLFVKYLFYLLVGYTFDEQDFVRKYLRTYFILIELFGVMAFIPVLVLLYAGVSQEAVLIVILALFVITRIILFSRIIVFFFNKKVNLLFGIAYLCSVEIIPYLLLVLGFVFMYKEDFFCIL
ncbi:MAG: hypothetical protein BGN96_09880 [Bacteroidales bacterium 45-6]|nr:MAG: hypothetical protein BGN96_09880 [Bacteroidales bacterium 45-6]